MIDQKNLIEIPNCPLCIEKLDGSCTGIYFDAMAKLFIYEKETRSFIQIIFMLKFVNIIDDN